AGFENTWFSAVEARGWDYVGRVRNTTKVCLRDEWVPNSSLHHRAIEKALDLGVALIRRRSPLRRRLGLGPKPTSSKRYRKTRKGTPGKNGTDRAARARAHDPWLLATSRTDEPAAIVAIYARRMRIEQTF